MKLRFLWFKPVFTFGYFLLKFGYFLFNLSGNTALITGDCVVIVNPVLCESFEHFSPSFSTAILDCSFVKVKQNRFAQFLNRERISRLDCEMNHAKSVPETDESESAPIWFHCNICSNQPTADCHPKLTFFVSSCQHIFCYECLRNFASHSPDVCPVCKTTMKVIEFRKIGPNIASMFESILPGMMTTMMATQFQFRQASISVFALRPYVFLKYVLLLMEYVVLFLDYFRILWNCMLI